VGDFRMPSLGSDMEAASLVQWQVKPGDPVHRGQIIAVVETVKGAIDVEAFEDGVVDALLVAPGTEVPVGTVLARIRPAGGAPGQPLAAPPAPPPASPPVPPPVAAPATVAPPPAAPVAGARLRVSPAARRRALAAGVDLTQLVGSGPEGVITLADVDAAARTIQAAAPMEPARDLAAMRQAIAAAMARSKREIPHYYLSLPVDMEAALAWLEDHNAERAPEERLLYAVLLIKAVAMALDKFPEFNGFYRDGGFVSSAEVHVGMAVALRGGGLVAPALHNARDTNLTTLMAAFRDLVQRARTGHLRSSELSDPTITVSSLGDRGVEGVFPIIYPPQVAIVGFGAVTERPWVWEGQIVPRRVLTASLAADHRVSDGRRGGQFLAAIAEHLQHPERL